MTGFSYKEKQEIQLKAKKELLEQLKKELPRKLMFEHDRDNLKRIINERLSDINFQIDKLYKQDTLF